MAFTGRYEFTYLTPTPGVDDAGNPIVRQVPTMFSLGGIAEDVARGIRFGLRKVTTINTVTAERVMETRETVVADPAP